MTRRVLDGSYLTRYRTLGGATAPFSTAPHSWYDRLPSTASAGARMYGTVNCAHGLAGSRVTSGGRSRLSTLDEFNQLVASHGLASPMPITHGFFLAFNCPSTVQVAQ